MFTKNDGSSEHDILQNQFTSFLSFAVSNARIDYIRAKIKRLQREQITEQYEILFAEEAFQIEDFTDNEAISQAIRRITIAFNNHTKTFPVYFYLCHLI